MNLSTFKEVFAVAVYHATEVDQKTEFSIGEILDKYNLEIKQTWPDTLLNVMAMELRVAFRRHLGPVRKQHVSMTPMGIQWVEDELGENVTAYLERHGAMRSDTIQPASGQSATDVAVQPMVDSQNWTGLPRHGVLSDDAVVKLKAALDTVGDAVTKINASNEEKAQARGYVLAIHALADAPEPPADLIWELVSRANQIAGIASLFVSIVALFSAVAN